MVHRSPRQSPRAGCRWVRLVGMGALLAGALWLMVAPALAAVDGDAVSVRVRREIERTDLVIERAIDEVRGAANRFCHQQLAAARDLQSRARKRFPGGEVSQADLKSALRLTIQARDHALKAIDAARLEKQASESVRRTVDRSQEQASEIVGSIERSGNPLARRVFEQGIDQLQRARSALRSGNLQQAMRLAGLASNLIDRAGQIAAEEMTAATAAATSVERTAALLREVEQALAESGSPAGGRARLVEATQLLRRAGEHLQRRLFGQALRLSLRARRDGLELLGELRDAPQPEVLAAMFEELRALAAEIAPEVSASGSRSAAQRLKVAEEMLAEARQLLADRKSRAALRLLVAVETLLREAADEARR